jgi:hypothetical protein
MTAPIPVVSQAALGPELLSDLAPASRTTSTSAEAST